MEKTHASTVDRFVAELRPYAATCAKASAMTTFLKSPMEKR
jgi:hypothetical protein